MAKRPHARHRVAAAADLMIRLDLNSPEFQEGLFRLEASELQQVVASLGRLRKLDWPDLYRHTGYRWEAVAHIRTR